MREDDLRKSSNIEHRRGIGGFAYASVIAHEVGQHLQNLVGSLPKVQQADQADANNRSAWTELMAGTWAHHVNERHATLTDADLQQAVSTATAIGDDRLNRAVGRAALPDSFTHGTSARRVQWATTGFHGGPIAGCAMSQGHH